MLDTSRGGYSINELLAVFIARTIEDEKVVVLGGANMPVPRAGALLAQMLHAPNIKVVVGLMRTYFSKEDVIENFEFIADARMLKLAESYIRHDEWLAQSYEPNIFAIGGLQIDRFGNTNLIGIGSSIDNLKVRGPGAVATATAATNVDYYYIVTQSHNKNTFVEKCDFISSVGYGTGGDYRKRLGLPGGGPRYVLTPLCIMDFEENSKRMRLKSLHNGVCKSDVIDNTGFDLIIPDDIPMTEPPTEDELMLLRTRIDPNGYLLENSRFIPSN
jgi:glutaconate CoA-transferase subunit B